MSGIKVSINWKGGAESSAYLAAMGEKAKTAIDQGVHTVALLFRDNLVKMAQAGHPEHPNVVTGRLAGSMRISGNNARYQVGSDAEYAPYVEFGHTQQSGRFVPALGKRLVADSVKAYPFFRPAITETFDTGDAQTVYDTVVRRNLGK